ncbi:MAG: toll/interleukin-1 receptor domain-containing protein [Armatimonadia bacterium]
MEPTVTRDHLFISYAWEDAPLAHWLALKLVSEGYAVWIDHLKLLGGESYPSDIDYAIKNRTFRVLAVMSHVSLSKENPKKERTTALNLAKERKEDFLIPLNAEGLKPTELDWMTSDLTFIPFHESWSGGLAQLLSKLAKIEAPRPYAQNGRTIAASAFLPAHPATVQPEVLYSNCYRFVTVPPWLNQYRIDPIDENDELRVTALWPSRKLSNVVRLAFWPPPEEMGLSWKVEGAVPWQEGKLLGGVDAQHAVARLLWLVLRSVCLRRHLRWDREAELYYVPDGLLPDNRIRFARHDGRKTYIDTKGQRRFGNGQFTYNLGFNFRIRRDILDAPAALLKVGLRIADAGGQPLSHHSANARRKSICKNWWNHQWLMRQLAVMSLLADGQDQIALGPSDGSQVILSTCGEALQAPLGWGTPPKRSLSELSWLPAGANDDPNGGE